MRGSQHSPRWFRIRKSLAPLSRFHQSYAVRGEVNEAILLVLSTSKRIPCDDASWDISGFREIWEETFKKSYLRSCNIKDPSFKGEKLANNLNDVSKYSDGPCAEHIVHTVV